MLIAKIGSYLCISVLLLTSSPLSAQKYTYAINKSGKVIGEVTADLTESGHTQKYEVISNVDFKVLWKRYNRKTKNTITYENGALQTSISGVYMNNALEDSSVMNLEQNGYNCYRYPDKKFMLNDPLVRFTAIKLYFKEPVGILKIYSERFLEYCRLEPLGGHKYKLHLPNGKVNFYTYVNSKLVEVFVERTWFNLEIKLK